MPNTHLLCVTFVTVAWGGLALPTSGRPGHSCTVKTVSTRPARTNTTSATPTPVVKDGSPVKKDASPLSRMRRYTTISMVTVVALYGLIPLTYLNNAGLILGVALALVPLLALAFFWEKWPPTWLTIVTLACTFALWGAAVILRDNPVISIVPATAMAIVLAQLTTNRARWIAAGAVALFIPAILGLVTNPAEDWRIWFFGTAIAYLAATGMFLLNQYAWNLYLEIDNSRRTAAQLAVMQERYRFASDLHDIQGHTLHVTRLKIELASKLIDRDPVAAHEQLAEARDLIAETLAGTRSLAFGERHVAVASELANAKELFEAADIRWSVTGEHSADQSGPAGHEELLGLVVREATTNILRHAQATAVTVVLGPHRVHIVNDGSPATTRPLSGLARLGERFQEAGGTLRTVSANGEFRTEATL